MALTPGTKLGPYEIVAPLGAGGMGEVYRARDSTLGRDVAVKVLPPAFSEDPDRLRRFKLEAQAAAALNHPNILAIYHVGQDNGTPYIVSELLDGESLRGRLQAGTLPLRKAIEYSIQIARGLAAAHGKGIIHRDLKPENIFLTKDGRVRILDFGLAKLLRPEEKTAYTDSPTLTGGSTPGFVLGTVGYMSPEQVRGQPVGPASDLFSFGAIVYEMLTSKRAFHGETAADTMSAILNGDPPELAEVNRQIPPALERIVRHCLEKNPEERFQSARDLAFDLDALSGISATSTAAVVETKSKPRKWLKPLAAALALLVLGAAGDQFLRRRTGPISLPTFHQLTFKRGSIYAARFAPDGQTVLYSASWDAQAPQLYSTGPDGPESRTLNVRDSTLFAASSGGIAMSVGCRAIFIADCEGTLASMPLSGGAPRELAEHVNAGDFTVDGSQLSVVRQVAGRYRVEFPTGKSLYESVGWVRYLRISPRGDGVAFIEHPERRSDLGFVVVLDGGGRQKLRSGPWLSLEGLGWSPRGDEVWVAGTKDHAWANEIHALDFYGKDRVLLRLPGILRLHDVSRDGRLLLSREIWRAGILFRGRGDSNERDLSWLDYSVLSDLSPDEKDLAFFEPGEASGTTIFAYMRKSDGSPAVRLGNCASPLFSPNQKWALCINLAGDQLKVLPTGVGETKSIAADPIVRYRTAGWLPSGNGIFFQGNDGHGWRVYTQDLNGGKPRPFTPEVLPQELLEGNLVSPDGKFVWSQDLDGNANLYPLAGGDPRPVQGMERGDRWMNWSNDGHSGYVADLAKVPARIFRLDLSTDKKQLLFELVPAGDPIGLSNIISVRVTPDGKSYAYTYERVLSELYLVEGLK